jgi:hypothetical protein
MMKKSASNTAGSVDSQKTSGTGTPSSKAARRIRHHPARLGAAHALHRAIERPNLARRTPRHLVQVRDFHLGKLALFADEGAQAFGQLGNIHDGHL